MQSTGLPPGGRIDFGAPHASRVLDVGSDVQLFCDDFLLTRGAAVSRDYPINIRFTPGTAAKEPAPVMLPGRDAPWETGGIYWVTVLYDGGRFRCWYNTDYVVDRDPRYPHQRPATIPGKVSHQLVAYAESEDGLTWRKPALGMVEVNGSTANNVVLVGDIDRYPGGGCVFIDPTAPTTERYKMLHCGRTPFGLRGAYSADGVAWSMYPWGYNIPGLDTQNVAGYDPVLGRYVAYIRSNSLKRGGRDVGDRPVLPQGWGRAVARIESVRFDGTHPEWSQPVIVLAPDHEDGLDTDFYNCPWSRYRDLHLMFFSPYHHWSGKLDLQLAVSRDNRTWIRPTRMPIVTTSGEPGAYDEFRIYAGPGILPAGPDRVALYTRTGQGPHNGAVDASYTPADWSTAGLRDGEEPHDGAMSRLTFDRDRFVGIEAGSERGIFATREISFAGSRLIVNVEPLGPDAALRVQVVEGDRAAPPGSPTGSFPRHDGPRIAGLTFDRCRVVSQDALDAPVTWDGDARLCAWAGKPVRLQFHLRQMRIYGFRFAE